jgi:hypothetical protein
LLVAASSLVALAFAIMRAEDGHEDASGYHPAAQGAAATAPQTMGSENPWDYVEGASCPINLTNGFGRIGNNQLSAHPQ